MRMLTAPLRAPATPEEHPGPKRVTVQEGHALWAETYDLSPNPLLALEEREMAAFLPALEGKYVLDIACGTGRWLGKLLARGACGGVGIDLSPEMLSQALTRAPLTGRLVRGDCLALPFIGEVADLVTCSFAIGYVQDLSALAFELARVAKDGASVLVSDFHPAGYRRRWRRSFRHADRVMEIASYEHSEEEIRAAFESAGLRHCRSVDCCLGEPERQIFERTGKGHLFPSACDTPAVLIMEFRRGDIPAVRSQ
jgi:ubiquinone/menaquinone biosynthesis C-methylase UbiE